MYVHLPTFLLTSVILYIIYISWHYLVLVTLLLVLHPHTFPLPHWFFKATSCIPIDLGYSVICISFPNSPLTFMTFYFIWHCLTLPTLHIISWRDIILTFMTILHSSDIPWLDIVGLKQLGLVNFHELLTHIMSSLGLSYMSLLLQLLPSFNWLKCL